MAVSSGTGAMTGLESLLDSTSKTSKTSKRKRDTQDATSKKSSKRTKMSGHEARTASQRSSLENINPAIGQMDARLLVDYVAQKTKKFQPDLPLAELERCYVSEAAVADTSTWDKPRMRDNLSDFLEHFAGPRRKRQKLQLSDASKESGHPHTLVISGAGLRAADLTRVLRKFQKKGVLVAKLFAKHIKFKEAVETVRKNRISIGVGTPQRIHDLLDCGALSSTNLETIVIDASHVDLKQRGVLDMRETQVPLIKLLMREELKARYASSDGGTRILFF